MKTILVTLLALSCVACNGRGQFKSSEQFEAAVQSWALAGKTLSDATATLKRLEFSCSGRSCSREVKGFPCMQKQQVFLALDPSGHVQETSIFKLPDGRIPTACL